MPKYIKKLPEKIPIVVAGEIYLLKNTEEAVEKFRQSYRIEDDIISWALVYLIKNRLADYRKASTGELANVELLNAAKNTLFILGKTWRDLEWLVHENRE